VEDILARRIRLLFLDAKAAMEAAPVVATIMANELNKDEQWINLQVISFKKISEGYLIKPQQ
jgi:glycerol-3-phosphate dehydrogenase